MDIGDRFAGTVSGWMNFCGNLVGAAAPMLTAWIATHYGWQAAILATTMAGLLGAFCWLFVNPDRPLDYRALAPQGGAIGFEGAAVEAAGD